MCLQSSFQLFQGDSYRLTMCWCPSFSKLSEYLDKHPCFLILLQYHWPTLISLNHQASKLSLFFREVFITREWKQQQNWESAFVLLFMLCGRWIRAGERSTDACYQPWQSYRDLQCSINLVNWIPNPDCWALGKKQTMLRELFCNAGLPVDTSTQRHFTGNLLLERASMPSWKKRLHLKEKIKKFPLKIVKTGIPQGELNVQSLLL